MGTYRTYILAVQSNDGFGRASDGGLPILQGNIDFLNGDGGTSGVSSFVAPGTTGTKTIYFSPDTTRYDLTGEFSGTFGINTLPAGFKITTKTINASFSRTANAELYARFDTPGAQECQIFLASGTDITVCTKPVITTLGTLLDGVGGRAVVITLGNNAGYGKISVRGNYIIESGSWSIDTPGPVRSGDTIDVSGTSNLNGVDSVDIYSPAGTLLCSVTSFDIQTPTALRFTLCNLGSYSGTIIFQAIGNGVQFSGSVVMGTLTAVVADGSGMYVLTPGKLNDTIYINSGGGTNSTEDVKIPNPFFKTGFLDG